MYQIRGIGRQPDPLAHRPNQPEGRPMATTLTDVIAFIVSDADHEALDRMGDAIRQRHKALRVIIAAAVREGMETRIDGLSTQYLNGLRGTVQTIETNRQKSWANVLLDKESTDRLRWDRKSNKHIPTDTERYLLPGIPLSCCRQP